MLAALAILSLGVVAYDALTRRAASSATETGARSWQQDKRATELRAARRARKDAAVRLQYDDVPAAERDELKRLVRDSERLQQRRESARAARQARVVNCCDAPSDDWRDADTRPYYDRWRSDSGGLDFAEAKRQALDESRDFAAQGDYSKPASRRAVLGKMHAAKLMAWEMCRAGCHGEQWYWIESDDGRLALSKPGGDALYLNPLGGDAWAVESRERSGWVELERFASYNEAVNDAQARLIYESPF